MSLFDTLESNDYDDDSFADILTSLDAEYARNTLSTSTDDTRRLRSAIYDADDEDEELDTNSMLQQMQQQTAVIYEDYPNLAAQRRIRLERTYSCEAAQSDVPPSRTSSRQSTKSTTVEYVALCLH
jgi:hypothetical protein